MASGYGHSGAASGDGKRRRSEGRSRGVRGSGSGSGDGQEYPGDPPTTHTTAGRRAGATEEAMFRGVRLRAIVEIKGWGGKGRNFNMDVMMLDGMETQKEPKLVAATVHDLARLYGKVWNPEYPSKIRLNIRRVELLIRQKDLADELLIGGDLLDKYVRDHPLKRVDVVAGSDEFKALKRNIAELALPFLKVLKDAIAEELSRAGRQRQDEAQILPFVEGVEHLEDSEIQRLKDQIASLKVTHAAELEVKDAKLTAKDNKIAILEETLRTGVYLFSTNQPPSPTLGFVESPPVLPVQRQEFLRDDE